MKVLPCGSKGCNGTCWLPDGKPYARAAWIGPHWYKCARCKFKNKIGAVEWNRLPELPEEKPEEHAEP